jgi:hypothetical protein
VQGTVDCEFWSWDGVPFWSVLPVLVTRLRSPKPSRMKNSLTAADTANFAFVSLKPKKKCSRVRYLRRTG